MSLQQPSLNPSDPREREGASVSTSQAEEEKDGDLEWGTDRVREKTAASQQSELVALLPVRTESGAENTWMNC